MDKIVRFDSVDSLGRCFAEAIGITRRGGGLEKIAGQVQPEVAAYLKTLKSDPAYQYVLMTPMGSFEYWGMNVNGDVFPDIALSFNREKDNPIPVVRALEARWLMPHGESVPPGNYTEFGYKSFLDAKRYRHHVNKNPEIAYGDIVLAVWNPTMHRVEVIARHDREKARRVGAEEIISDLDAGKPRQISMGCRVPFDVCTVCGHISRTPTDYCSHLKSLMGSMMPDGRAVGAVNFFPKFFDLSDVFVPAAKEAGTLMKVASAGVERSFKAASQRKVAEISKEVSSNTTKQVSDCAATEPDLPRSVVHHGDMGALLATLSALGIVMKPGEFQDGMLHRMGMNDLGDELYSKRQVFEPDNSPTASMDFGASPNMDLARILSSLLPDRSGLYPHLPQRMLKIMIIKASPVAETTAAPDMPVLKKVAHAYNAYRKSLRTLPQILNLAVEQDPEYYNTHFFQELLTDSMEKLSSSYYSMDLSTPLSSLYVYNAYQNGVVTSAPSFDLPRNSPARALLFPVL